MFILLSLADENGIDIKQFEKVYKQYKNLMFSVSFYILKDKMLAEDAVQQAFIKIIEIFNKIEFENCNKTRNLFVLICKNISINMYNSRKNKAAINLEESIFNNLKDPKSQLDYDNIENEVEGAIKSLPSIYSDVIYCKYVLGYSNSEISKLLNISVGNVRQRISRGKEKLRKILIEEGVEIYE
ncbi:RNA polymerase sigma factor [Miniphocaeibacter halophilus]|uniref:Sigma-70 family RNA polymerase sigma factor n=1 Tax=Miniphocaeibacter halophilus TaxID=2931922 RepID=A0AC61N206_9FIRM|nr:sigma-70 family RNA polymerase sigma factor [Miniphocaeibacter halophilus]QQK08959.1 sigma-70 family RNA polymerase sigma factor [Miniphocaeibacter halophilus]